MMQGKTIKPDPFKRMQGADVTAEWLETDPTAMTEPIVVEKPDGLGMEMPEDLTVADVAEIVGADTPVEVIGTSSHVYAYAFTEVTSGPSSSLDYRCGVTEQPPRVDPWQMGRILRHRAREARKGSQRHLARDLGHGARGKGTPSPARARRRLGREVLACSEEGARACISQGAAVLLDGRREGLDGELIKLLVICTH